MFTDDAGRIQPIWAFVFSAMLSVVAFLVAGYSASAFAGDHVLRFEALFRPALALMLLAIFSWLLTIGNHIEEHRIAAQGLPLSPGWARQFGVGCAFGVLLVGLAVVPLAIWGELGFRTVMNSRSLARVAVVLAVVISGALAEELMFRGYPFQRLTEGIGPAGAIAVFSVLFGVVHLSNPGATVWGLVNTVAIGVLLSVAISADSVVVDAVGLSLCVECHARDRTRAARQRPALVQRRGARHGERSEVADRWQLWDGSQRPRGRRHRNRTCDRVEGSVASPGKSRRAVICRRSVGTRTARCHKLVSL